MTGLRNLHRWTMTIFGVLLVYWALSGLAIALYDAADPTQVWAIEGGGPGARLNDFAKTALPLPEPATYQQGIAAALAATRGMPLASVDLRLTKAGIPRLQLAEASGSRDTERRFYAASGHPMSQEVADDEGRATPPNVIRRNLIKSWHRGDIAWFPGQLLGLLAGIGLVILTVTGTFLYIRSWQARRRMNRSGLFWQSRDSLWRRLHRWISIVAAAFVLNIAVSGVVLAWGEIQLRLYLQYGVLINLYPRPTPLPPVSDGPLKIAVPDALDRVYAAAVRASAGAPVVAVELVRHDGTDKGLATLGGAAPRTLAFNAASGARTRDWRESGVQRGNGYYADWHQALKRIHRGDIIGSFVGRYMDILAGLAILYLTISGFVLYFQARSRRVTLGRQGWFWK